MFWSILQKTKVNMNKRKWRKFIRQHKKKIGIFLVFSLLLFATLLGSQNIGTVDGRELIENIPEIPESEKQAYIIPDPCGLDSVVCHGEEVAPIQRDSMEVTDMIIAAALEHKVDVDHALQIAWCESSYNSTAQNPTSSAKGVYQFTDGTWGWIEAEGHQFDAKENIKQFMIWYKIYPEWWAQCL